MTEEKEKHYPDDYTPEQQEKIKEIVIARLKQLPDNFRMSMGSLKETEA